MIRFTRISVLAQRGVLAGPHLTQRRGLAFFKRPDPNAQPPSSNSQPSEGKKDGAAAGSPQSSLPQLPEAILAGEGKKTLRLDELRMFPFVSPVGRRHAPDSDNTNDRPYQRILRISANVGVGVLLFYTIFWADFKEPHVFSGVRSRHFVVLVFFCFVCCSLFVFVLCRSVHCVFLRVSRVCAFRFCFSFICCSSFDFFLVSSLSSVSVSQLRDVTSKRLMRFLDDTMPRTGKTAATTTTITTTTDAAKSNTKPSTSASAGGKA